jgi:hypothetical protein
LDEIEAGAGETSGTAGTVRLFIPFINAEPCCRSTRSRPGGWSAENSCYLYPLSRLLQRRLSLIDAAIQVSEQTPARM